MKSVVGRHRTAIWVWFAILAVMFATMGSECGGGGDEEAGGRSGDSDDDDDVYIPPPDDDGSDDDTSDDDVTDDDTADDDTADDDTADDDTTDDDTTDDDTTDDDTTDDDTADDDTGDDDTGTSPAVVINTPTEGGVLEEYLVDIDADVANVVWNSTVVEMDGTDISNMVSRTATKVTGSVAVDAGEHTLTITVFDSVTAAQASDSVTFNMDMGKIIIHEPTPGAEVFSRDVPVNVEFININQNTMHLYLDGVERTGDLGMGGGFITGELPNIEVGDHIILVEGTHPNHVTPSNPTGKVSASSYFTVTVVGAHIQMTATPNMVQTGGTVDVTYAVYDDDGVDRTAEADMTWNVSPFNSVVIDEDDQTVKFNAPGVFEIQLSTVIDSTPLQASAFVWVDVQQPDRVEIFLSTSFADAGETVDAWGVAYNEDDDEIYAEILFEVWPSYGVTIDQGDPAEITAFRAGDLTVRGYVAGTDVFDEQILHVSPGPPVSITIQFPNPVIEEGDFVHPEVVLRDQYGNRVTDVGYTLVVSPPGTSEVDTPGPGDITFPDSGYYLVKATADAPFSGLFAQAAVLVADTTPPDIRLYTPARGTWTTSSTIFVSGIVEGCDPDEDIIKITPDIDFPFGFNPDENCEFERDLDLTTGLNIFDIDVLEDASSLHTHLGLGVMQGSKHADGQLVPDALLFRMNERGFDQLEDILLPIVNTYMDQVPAMIYGMNPIFNEREELWGLELWSAKGEVTFADLGAAYLDVESFESGPTIHMGVTGSPGVRLDWRIRGAIAGIGYSVSGQVTIDSVDVDAHANVYGDSAGRLVVVSDQTDLTLNGLNIDINNFPDFIEGLFNDIIEWLMEVLINDALADLIPDLLSDLLSQIPQGFDFSIGDVDFAASYGIGQIVWDLDGGSFYMDLNFNASDTSGTVPDHGGSLNTPGIAPGPSILNANVPGTSTPYGFGVVLSDDFLNRLLYGVYRAGLISIDASDIAATDDLAMQLIFAGLDSYGDCPCDISVNLRPLLPPVALFEDPTIATATGLGVDIQIGELMVDWVIDNGGDQTLFLQMAANIILPAELSVTDGNLLEVSFGTPEMLLTVISEPLGFGWDTATLTELVNQLTPLLIPVLGDLIGGIEIPSFDDVALDILSEQVIGLNYDYGGIFADLVVVP
ncbi:MAG: hypothetical protein IT350_10790 [Deltaproteobacteria bacterium]|nr:hypothetical protein [Deltaproteobacteria bacterium]